MRLKIILDLMSQISTYVWLAAYIVCVYIMYSVYIGTYVRTYHHTGI